MRLILVEMALPSLCYYNKAMFDLMVSTGKVVSEHFHKPNTKDVHNPNYQKFQLPVDYFESQHYSHIILENVDTYERANSFIEVHEITDIFAVTRKNANTEFQTRIDGIYCLIANSLFTKENFVGYATQQHYLDSNYTDNVANRQGTDNVDFRFGRLRYCGDLLDVYPKFMSLWGRIDSSDTSEFVTYNPHNGSTEMVLATAQMGDSTAVSFPVPDNIASKITDTSLDRLISITLSPFPHDIADSESGWLSTEINLDREGYLTNIPENCAKLTSKVYNQLYVCCGGKFIPLPITTDRDNNYQKTIWYKYKVIQSSKGTQVVMWVNVGQNPPDQSGVYPECTMCVFDSFPVSPVTQNGLTMYLRRQKAKADLQVVNSVLSDIRNTFFAILNGEQNVQQNNEIYNSKLTAINNQIAKIQEQQNKIFKLSANNFRQWGEFAQSSRDRYVLQGVNVGENMINSQVSKGNLANTTRAGFNIQQGVTVASEIASGIVNVASQVYGNKIAYENAQKSYSTVGSYNINLDVSPHRYNISIAVQQVMKDDIPKIYNQFKRYGYVHSPAPIEPIVNEISETQPFSYLKGEYKCINAYHKESYDEIAQLCEKGITLVNSPVSFELLGSWGV